MRIIISLTKRISLYICLKIEYTLVLKKDTIAVAKTSDS